MKRKIRVWWHNPPTSPRVTIERSQGSVVEVREVGPQGELDLAEAEVLSGLPRAQLLRAIRIGDLQVSSRVSGRRRIRLRDLIRLLREDAEDLAVALRRRRERTIPAEIVYRRLAL